MLVPATRSHAAEQRFKEQNSFFHVLENRRAESLTKQILSDFHIAERHCNSGKIMRKMIYFISSHCLFLSGNDCCSRTSSASPGRCWPVPPSLPQAAGEPRWALPTLCPVRRARQSRRVSLHGRTPCMVLLGSSRLLGCCRLSRGGAKAWRRCPSGAKRPVAASGAGLLGSPQGAGACPRATQLLCREMLPASPDVGFGVWPQLSHRHAELAARQTRRALPHVPRLASAEQRWPSTQHSFCTAAAGAAQAAGTGSSQALKVQHSACTATHHTDASHKLLLFTETSQNSTSSLLHSKAATRPRTRCQLLQAQHAPAASAPLAAGLSWRSAVLPWVSPLLSPRGRFSSSEFKAHRSGAKLPFCPATARLWRGARHGSSLSLRNAACTRFVPAPHKASQLPASDPGRNGAGGLRSRLWVRPCGKISREICLSEAGTHGSRAHEDAGFSTRAAKRTNKPDGQS